MTYQQQQKTEGSKPVANIKPLLLRLILGCIFVYSALWKIQNPHEFLQIVLHYQMVPKIVADYVAVVVPWVEFICGILLMLDVFVSQAVYLLVISLCVFTGAQLTVLYKGLSVDCGCFPVLGYAPKVGWLTLFRNVVLLSMCAGAFGQSIELLSSYSTRASKALLVGVTFTCVVGLIFVSTYKRDTVFHYPAYARQYSSDLMRNAVNEHKVVVLVFVSGTCDYCFSLFDDQLKSNRLAKRMRGVQCLIVSKSLVPRRLIKSYDVRIYPNFVFVDRNGNVKRELVGYHNTHDIIKSLDAMKRGGYTVAELPL